MREADGRHEERRDRLDRDRDPEVGRAPDHVQDEQAEPDGPAVGRAARLGWHRQLVQARSIRRRGSGLSPPPDRPGVCDLDRGGLVVRWASGGRAPPSPAGRPCTAGSPPRARPSTERNPTRCRPSSGARAGTSAGTRCWSCPSRRSGSPAAACASRPSGSRPSLRRIVRLLSGPPSEYWPIEPVRADDAVARHDQRDRVVAERRADGPDRPWPADLGRDPAVRPDLAARDLERLAPDVLLERAVPAQVEVDPDPAIAAESPRDGLGQASGQRLMANAARPVAARWRASKAGVVRGGCDRRDAAAVPGDEERPDRRIDVGVGVGQADLDEHLGPQPGGGRGGQVGEGGLDGRVGRGGIERVVHAVISSSSWRASASSIVRNRAIPGGPGP